MSSDIHKAVEQVLDKHDLSKREAYSVAYKDSESAEERVELAKAAPNGSVEEMSFDVASEGSDLGVLSKADDSFLIWGPASVEVVDKEQDRIKASALQEALPQLLKRRRLSWEHSDQIVGDIRKRIVTDEPKEVEINGRTYKRDTFPTDVLELSGMEPALYVAGDIYGDTKKAREVREQIQKGEVDSYSISGQAIVTEMAVKNGETFTDILKLDLSAVTLCKNGMNQMAEFDVIDGLSPQRAAKLAKSKLNKRMKDNDSVEKFIDELDKTLDERLPEGELATKGDVENIVDDKLDTRLKADEGSPAEGSTERPSGDSNSPTNQSDEYEGDADEWGDDPSEDSDKVEEKSGYTLSELAQRLPADTFKAVAPLLERGKMPGDEEGLDEVSDDDEPPEMGEGEPEPEPEPVPEPDPIVPEEEMAEEEEEEEMPEMGDEMMASQASKALDNLDVAKMSNEQLRALLKARQGDSGAEVAKSGVSSPGSTATPSHGGQTEEGVLKADDESVSRDPALRKVYDENGNPQV